MHIFIAATVIISFLVGAWFASRPTKLDYQPSFITKTLEEANPQPDSMWLVLTDCRYEVIHVAVDGSGYFIPGQEPCWALDTIDEWFFEIKPLNQ